MILPSLFICTLRSEGLFSGIALDHPTPNPSVDQISERARTLSYIFDSGLMSII